MVAPDQRHVVTFEGAAHAAQPVAAGVMQPVGDLIQRQHAFGANSGHFSETAFNKSGKSGDAIALNTSHATLPE